jgi:hypothetical protein
MGFYGRETLLELADQLISVGGGHVIPRTGSRPTLMVEGCGGSGRSELLAAISGRWSGRTPTALVDSLDFPVGSPDQRHLTARLSDSDQSSGIASPGVFTGADISGVARNRGRQEFLGDGVPVVTPVRLMLGEIMRRFANEVPGYKVCWSRVPLMLIAIKEPAADDESGQQEMIRRLNTYQDRDKLAGLLKAFMVLAPSIKGFPGAVPVDAGQLAEGAAKLLLRRMQRSRWRAQRSWGQALTWFGPNSDDGAPGSAISELVRFSLIAARPTGPQMRELDSYLVKAFLADLAESAADIDGRPFNFLLLLDNADCQAGRTFLNILMERRHEMLAPGANPDPLAVIACGGEIGALGRGHKPPRRVPVGRLEGEGSNAALIRVGLDSLSQQEVGRFMKDYPWSPRFIEPASHVVEHLVYRLTAGHCLATKLVLQALQIDPLQARGLDRLLGQPGEEGGISERIVETIVAGLSTRRVFLRSLRDDLVTVAAARHKGEAALLRDLLASAEDERRLLTETLWSDRTADGQQAMIPAVRHLLLRELAARPPCESEPGRPGWNVVFGHLSEHVSSDEIGRLHSKLALGGAIPVAAELTGRLEDAEWLTLLDALVVTFRPRQLVLSERNQLVPAPEETPPADAEAPQTRSDGVPDPAVLGLLTSLQRSFDPCADDLQGLHNLYLNISRQYSRVADHAPPQWLLMLERAEYYRSLAEVIA